MIRSNVQFPKEFPFEGTPLRLVVLPVAMRVHPGFSACKSTCKMKQLNAQEMGRFTAETLAQEQRELGL